MRLAAAAAHQLLGEEAVDGDEDEGAKAPALAVGGGDEVLLEDRGEILLGHVAGVVVRQAAAADVL
ncbi:MAG: hypothetical protein J6333_05005, partial [Planctomycetes bacterium]|nr:hypothetical protein [Planctomycetota bacterium]